MTSAPPPDSADPANGGGPDDGRTPGTGTAPFAAAAGGPGTGPVTGDVGLLGPLWADTPAAAATGDTAVLQAMLDAEAALTRAQAALGLAPARAAEAVGAAARAEAYDAAALARRAAGAGNPVVPLVADLTEAVAAAEPTAAEYVHRGATSQDILDTALVLVAARTLDGLLADLRTTADALAQLAAVHRDTPMAARTLTQHAVPTTFGLKAAGWRSLVLDAHDRLYEARCALPAQLGGAAGTLAAFGAYAGPAAAGGAGSAAGATSGSRAGADRPAGGVGDRETSGGGGGSAAVGGGSGTAAGAAAERAGSAAGADRPAGGVGDRETSGGGGGSDGAGEGSGTAAGAAAGGAGSAAGGDSAVGGGDVGVRLLERYAEELGLAVPGLPWHVLRTPVAELGSGLALCAGALGKVAGDVLVLTRTEVGEVAEGDGGGSSAMPHKNNPVRAALIAAAARQVPALAAVLYGSMAAEDERPAGAWHAEWQPLREALRLTAGAARAAAELARGLEVHPARMRANLGLTGGLPAAERLAAALTPRLGRARARRLVSEAARRAAAEGGGLAQALEGTPELSGALAPARLRELLDPAAYTGSAAALTDRALARRPRGAAAPTRPAAPYPEFR